MAAAPADMQLNQFPMETCRPDEVALTVDEIITRVNLLVDNNLIKKETANRLKELKNLYNF